MLTIERGDQLTGVKVGKRNEGRLGEAILRLDPLADAAGLGRKHHAAQDRRHLDLDLHAASANQQAPGLDGRAACTSTTAPGTAVGIAAAIRRRAASISVRDASRSATGRKVRSMSTDSRGRSRQKRLMAVPPFRAKQASAATVGSTLTSRRTWSR